MREGKEGPLRVSQSPPQETNIFILFTKEDGGKRGKVFS